jgi:predicted transcriptional regulator
MTATGTKNERVKLSLEVSGEMNRTLEQLASTLDASKSEVLRKAIALMQVAIDAREHDQVIGLVDRKSKQLVTTIVGI